MELSTVYGTVFLALDSFFIGACSLRHCSSIKMPESDVSHGLLWLIGRLSKASWTSVTKFSALKLEQSCLLQLFKFHFLDIFDLIETKTGK